MMNKNLETLSTVGYSAAFRRKQTQWGPWTYRRVQKTLLQHLKITNIILLQTKSIGLTLARVDRRLFIPSIKEMLTDIHTKVGIDFGKMTVDIIKKQIDSVWLDNYYSGLLYHLNQRGTAIADTTIAGLQSTLFDAAEAGLSIPQSSKLLQTEFRRLSPSRATRIARTEIVSASNRGSLTTIKTESDDLGLTAVKVWKATSNSRTRSSHQRANGQRRPLDQPFTVQGQSLEYPGDPSGSASNVINCRCTMIYEFDEPDFLS